jgi:hypothetical protein
MIEPKSIEIYSESELIIPITDSSSQENQSFLEEEE